MDFDPHEHFPKVVRNLSEQFGIRHVPGGMLLPNGFALPSLSVVRGASDEPSVGMESRIPDETGGMVDLTLGSGTHGIFSSEYPFPNPYRSVMSLSNYVDERDMDMGIEAGVDPDELEDWRYSENYGRDRAADISTNYHGPTVDEAMADIPSQIGVSQETHPWIKQYNASRIHHLRDMTGNGRYLIGIGDHQYSFNDSDPREYYRLEPATGEPVERGEIDTRWLH